MDLNIVNAVEEHFNGHIKTASDDSISSAKALLANLSKGIKVNNSDVKVVVQSLLNKIDSFKKMSKISSFIEELDNNSQIDECDVIEKIAELSDMSDMDFEIEKRAFKKSFNSSISNLFGENQDKVASKRIGIDERLGISS